jgi:PAS domain S-box-containing protein
MDYGRERGAGTDMEEKLISILLVEDEEAHAELVLRAFEAHRSRFSVQVAGSLAQAQDFLSANQPDLVLCDYLLPDGHGIDLISPQDGGRRFPMVLLTSHGDERLAVEAMKAGVLDYIVKSEQTFAQTPHIAERALRQWTHIIERDRAEQALKVNEARYRELFDNMSSGVAVFEAVDDGRDFLFKDHNKAGGTISQVRNEEIIGRKLLEVIPGIKDTGLLDTYQRVWKTGIPERHPTSLYEDDKLRIWIDCYVYKLPTGEIVSVYDDVTQRRESEEELRRWEHMFRHGEWGIVASMGDNETVDMLNPAYARMHGYTVDELRGRPVDSLYAPEVRGELSGHIRLIDEKGHHTYESLHIKKDGTVFPVMVDATAVKDEQGRVLYRAVNVQDLTERKKLEEQLLQAQKMEAVGRLAGGIAHDFNNLLTIILGYSDVAFRDIPRDDPMYDDFQGINDAAHRAAALTRQL